MNGMSKGEQGEQTIRLGVQELIGGYAECIDEDRLEEWPDFFADPCRYLIISRTNYDAGMRQGVMYAATRGMLLDRVFTIRRANLFEPHRYRHVVGPIRLKSVEDTTAIVHSHFIVARIMHTGETTLFATGRYLDRIDISTDDYRFLERVVVLDSDQIDTLLAIPL